MLTVHLFTFVQHCTAIVVHTENENFFDLRCKKCNQKIQSIQYVRLDQKTELNGN